MPFERPGQAQQTRPAAGATAAPAQPAHPGQVWQTPRGRLAQWTLPAGVFVFQLIGHGDRSFVEPIVAGFERSLQGGSLNRGGGVQMFVDVELMTAYDSELRTEVTAALFKDRRRIQSLHILVRTKIVSMGVAVANLALGGLMTIHKDPVAFQRALQAGVTRAGIVGFSAAALASERLRRPG